MNRMESLLSSKRLEKYNGSAELYFYNIRLCESFYPALNCLEIILRNRVDAVLSKHIGDDWIFRPEYHIGKNQNNYSNAISNLKRQGRDIANKNHIISELSFGFWSWLFSDDYVPLIWDKCNGALADIFPHHRGTLTQNKAFSELNDVREYRNRIFHYGSLAVCRAGQMQCHTAHYLIYALIKDIDKGVLIKELRRIDRFRDIFAKGRIAGFIKL
jgi:hypothetical protein